MLSVALQAYLTPGRACLCRPQDLQQWIEKVRGIPTFLVTSNTVVLLQCKPLQTLVLPRLKAVSNDLDGEVECRRSADLPAWNGEPGRSGVDHWVKLPPPLRLSLLQTNRNDTWSCHGRSFPPSPACLHLTILLLTCALHLGPTAHLFYLLPAYIQAS